MHDSFYKYFFLPFFFGGGGEKAGAGGGGGWGTGREVVGGLGGRGICPAVLQLDTKIEILFLQTMNT